MPGPVLTVKRRGPDTMAEEHRIQDKLIEQWAGTGDNDNVLYAIECARTCGCSETVALDWRWLDAELSELYEADPDIAAACCSYIKGWIAGASAMLARALLASMGGK